MSISLQHPTTDSCVNEIDKLISAQTETPKWLRDIQRDNTNRFAEQSFPTRKTEHWKYNDLSSLRTKSFLPASQQSIDSQDFDSLLLPLNDAIKCVFINGIYSEALSSTELSSAVKVTRFVNANERQADSINQSLKHAQQDRNLFINLNSAISNDGLLIEIEKNIKVEQPIYLVHLSNSTVSDQIATNQVIIQAGSSSQSQVIEHFVSLKNDKENKSFLTSQQTLIELTSNSHLAHHRVSVGTQNNQSIARVLCRLAENANLSSFYYSEGGVLDKTDIDIMHQGVNSESNLTGIYLPSEDNCVDFHTCIEHQVPHCNSRETFRGIIADSAKATFNGKIHIFRDAQKSDAQLNNKNLLLTNSAEINTKPELEIYADDVVCAHGATIAKIDEKAIYYLKTRGINEMQAKKMLSIGFINELLLEVKNETLKEFLTALVQKSLSNLR
jgi:Fe-S cluster assembly protein SufD